MKAIRKIFTLMLTLTLILGMMVLPSYAATMDGTYTIITKLSSSMVLDVNGNSYENNTNVQIYKSNNTNAQVFTVTQVSSGWYKIIHEISGKALDVESGKKASGVNVQIYDYNGSDAQLWKFVSAGSGYYYIQNKLGYYLDVAGASKTSGTNVQVYSGNQTDSQKWQLKSAAVRYDGTYNIVTKLSGSMMLDVDGNSFENNTNVQIYKSNGTSGQVFTVTQVSSGWYKIIHEISGKALDVASGKKASGVNVQIYDYNGSDAQLWKFVSAGSGYYYIQNKLGYYLDVAGASKTSGTNVQVYSGNQTDSQKWQLKSATVQYDGTYNFVTKLKSSMVLDVSENSSANNTNVQIYASNETNGQVFTVTQVSSGWYKIIHAGSGKALDVAGGKKASGANVQIYDYNGSDAQLWKFVSAGSGYYYIQNKLGYYLDVAGASKTNGTNVQVYSSNQTDSQKWKLQPTTVKSTNTTTTTSGNSTSYTTEQVTFGENETVVDTFNGVDALYKVGEHDSDTTYSCAAFVKRYYSTIYGVSVSNLLTGKTPAASSGSFSVTNSPKAGDIGYQTNSKGYGHWFIIKSVNSDGTYTIIEQNWKSNSTTTTKNRKVSSSTKGFKVYRWSGRTD